MGQPGPGSAVPGFFAASEITPPICIYICIRIRIRIRICIIRRTRLAVVARGAAS
jgi:hypothetical protein